MESNKFTTTIVTAEKGKYLTQAGDIEIMNRVIAERIALGINDSIANWVEITQEEADAYREAQNKARKEEEEKMRKEEEEKLKANSPNIEDAEVVEEIKD